MTLTDALTNWLTIIGLLAAGGLVSFLAYKIIPHTAVLFRMVPAPTVKHPRDPVPAAWYDIIEQRVPLSRGLNATDRDQLLKLAQSFLRDYPIEGCEGLEVTEEMRVTIAAQASMLLLRSPYPTYPKLRGVLLYPSTFVARRDHILDKGRTDGDQVLLGEAWHGGMVVLSWQEASSGSANQNDGRNVVLHEFAHVLDVEDGAFDGIPLLDSPSAYRAWGMAMSSQFQRHRERVERDEDVKLDPYGATNRAEFFAVATEAFFERPQQLLESKPDVYQVLRDFYGQDPAARS